MIEIPQEEEEKIEQNPLERRGTHQGTNVDTVRGAIGEIATFLTLEPTRENKETIENRATTDREATDPEVRVKL